MALSATPVDAELATPGRPTGLIRSIGAVTDGSDFETPNVLGYLEAPKDAAKDERPQDFADPGAPNGPGENRYQTDSPERPLPVHWIEGYYLYPDDCDGGHIVDPCQLGSNADPVDTGQASIIGPIQPFIISASDTCSTFGAPHDFRLARAERKLFAVQSKVLEAEFWSGAKAVSQGWTNNQYLRASSGLTVLGTAPVGGVFGYIDGLAALEQAISDGSAWERGVIHASPQLVTHWISAYLVFARPSDGLLTTGLGTIVVAGSGYPGTGPQSAINPNRLEWAYATPVPQIRLGEVTFAETDTDTVAVDRAANQRTIRASRFASIAMSNCFRAAALITMASASQIPGS